jgi:hypothetical protein
MKMKSSKIIKAKRIIILILMVIGCRNLYSQNVTDSIICSSRTPLWIFTNDSINEIELFYEDYEIVDTYKYENNGVVLKLKITNLEKLNRLKNSTNPTIFINFDNHQYKATGLHMRSSLWTLDDLSFPIDNEGKTVFFENGIINFRGFKYKE